MQFVLDTNAVIYLQKGLLAEALSPGNYGISVITEMELLAFTGLDSTQLFWLRRFLDAMVLIDLDREVRTCAIELRKNYRLKLPDAIVAASAITRNATLISNDTQLARIAGLRLQVLRLI
ncbi:Ribonuclease VapC [Gammaproteobacteria bacterium]